MHLSDATARPSGNNSSTLQRDPIVRTFPFRAFCIWRYRGPKPSSGPGLVWTLKEEVHASAFGKIISVDDHITEPPHLWTDRLPARYKMTGPTWSRLTTAVKAWAYEDQLIKIRRGNALPLQGFAESDEEAWNRYDEMRPGCYDPKARLSDMDTDGSIGPKLAFPDFCRFSGHRFLTGKDQELALLCVEAYNDFMLGRMVRYRARTALGLGDLALLESSGRPARVGPGCLPQGFMPSPSRRTRPSSAYPRYTQRTGIPLWAAFADADLPICMHIGSSSRVTMTSDDAPGAVANVLLGTNSMMACTDWLFSGALERFPSLQIVFSGGGCGWGPYIVERCVDSFHRYGDSQAPRYHRTNSSQSTSTCASSKTTSPSARSMTFPLTTCYVRPTIHTEVGPSPTVVISVERPCERTGRVAIKIAETNARNASSSSEARVTCRVAGGRPVDETSFPNAPRR